MSSDQDHHRHDELDHHQLHHPKINTILIIVIIITIIITSSPFCCFVQRMQAHCGNQLLKAA